MEDREGGLGLGETEAELHATAPDCSSIWDLTTDMGSGPYSAVSQETWFPVGRYLVVMVATASKGTALNT